MIMGAEHKLIAISMLTAILNQDEELVQTIIEIDDMAGTYAVTVALGIATSLLHAQPAHAGVTLSDVLEKIRDEVSNEL